MRRSPLTTLCELLLPLTFLLGAAVLHSFFSPVAVPAREFSRAPLRVAPISVLPARLSLAGQQLALVADSPTPPLLTAVAELAAWLPVTYPAFNGSAFFSGAALRAGFVVPALGSPLLRLFNSSTELDAWVGAPTYGAPGTKLLAAIVLLRAGDGGGGWEYKLRLNSSEAPTTLPGAAVATLQRGTDLTAITSYVQLEPSFGDNLSQQKPPDPRQALPMPGFTSLQLMVDRFILSRALRGAGAAELEGSAVLNATRAALGMLDAALPAAFDAEVAALGAPQLAAVQGGLRAWLAAEALPPQGVSFVPFPVTPYTDTQGFFSALAGVFPLYLVISILFPVARLVRGVVWEKEARLAEGVRMVGAAEGASALSWLAVYGALFTAIACGSTLIACLSFYKNTAPGVVFLTFLLFAWSSAAWAWAVTAFFSAARSAASLGLLSFLVLAFPYYGVSATTAPRSAKLGASLCAPTAFGLLLDALSAVEANGVGVQWRSVRDPLGLGYAPADGLAWLAADVALYLLLGWYSSAVMPTRWRAFGLARPPCFCVQRAYWREVGEAWLGRGGGADGAPAPTDCARSRVAYGTADAESLDAPSALLLAQAQCVSAVGLVKAFPTGGRGGRAPKPAVAGVSFDFFPGQITALLGHNGAGKSTLIGMLTGLLPPTGGFFTFFGADSRRGLAALRAQLGVCPQQDVLWPTLTVREHLQTFAEVRLLPGGAAGVAAAVEKAMADVGLREQAGALAGTLSGGQKRKLCVAIALLGDPRVVFLDEPTSGMDPHSRRATWNILQNARSGRVILFTTHFMDEADILGDRIAIMAEGQMQCVGSSDWLKRRFGVGYVLTLARAKGASARHAPAAEVLSAARAFAPAAALGSDVGAEVMLRLPLDAPMSALLAALEAGGAAALGLDPAATSVSLTTLEDVFMQVAHRSEAEKEEAALLQREGGRDAAAAAVAAPPSPPPRFSGPRLPPTFFRHFSALLKKRAAAARRDTRTLLTSVLVPAAMVLAGLLFIGLAIPAPYPDMLLSTAPFNAPPGAPGGPPRFPNVLPALAWRPGPGAPWAEGAPGPPSPATERVLACVPPDVASRAAGVGSSWLRPSTPPSAFPDPYGFAAGAPPELAPAATFAAFLLADRGARAATTYGALLLPSGVAAGASDGAAGGLLPASNYSAGGDFFNASSALAATLFINTSAVHGAPVYLNVLTSALFAAAKGDGCWGGDGAAAGGAPHAIVAHNHPLPFTSRQTRLLGGYLAGSMATLTFVALAFLPAGFAAGVVKEREVGAKHQQLISGVSLPAYWAAHWVFDTAAAAATCALVVVLFVAFRVEEFSAATDGRFAALCAAMGLYALAAPPQAYLLSFLFSSPSAAQSAVLMFNLGAVLAMIVAMILMLGVFPGSCDAYDAVIWLFRVAPGPGFLAGNSLYALAFLDIRPSLLANCARARGQTVTDAMLAPIGAFDARATGTNAAFLGATAVVAAALVLIVDTLLSQPRTRLRLREAAARAVVCCAAPPSGGGGARGGREATDEEAAVGDAVVEEEDAAVAEERARVAQQYAARTQGSGGGGDAILLHELRKVYELPPPRRGGAGCLPRRRGGLSPSPPVAPSEKVAVCSLSFGVPHGSVFGFLGVNGAGKSTTMGVLTGDALPTSGGALLAGHSIVGDVGAVRRSLGYCPQVDAVLELLSVREHLLLYGRIKGLPEGAVAREAGALEEALGISAFRDRAAGALSGGTKRKLCLALALMGAPALLMLDEITTGVDPVAARRLWGVVAAAAPSATTILTTHSLEEAEALCGRIGIMVGGRLRALGSAAQLRERFGGGYSLEARAPPPPRGAVDALAARAAEWARARGGGGGSGALRVARRELEPLCAALGAPPGAAAGVCEAGAGWALHGAYGRAADGALPAQDVAAWLADELSVARAVEGVACAFPGAALRERAGAALRFTLPHAGGAARAGGGGRRLSELFKAAEELQAGGALASFSIAALPLEAVFNALAGEG